MRSRKVSIITMHRVLNAGSVLQAYALQKEFIQMIGMSPFGVPLGACLSEDLIESALQNERDWSELESSRSLSRESREGALCR